MPSSHTVLLIQSTTRLDSRTWSDYESVTECLEGICKVFETFIAKKQGGVTSVTYDVNQVFEFLDKLTDISVMVFNRESAQYIPRNRSWIKQKIFELMRSRCAHPAEGEKLIVGY